MIDITKEDLKGTNLCKADLRGANLREADLWGANLWGANLREANLRGANLRGVNLREVNLRGADLRGVLGFLKAPSFDTRGYDAFLVLFDDGIHIQAGCRDYNLNNAREHWGEGYKDKRNIGNMYLWVVQFAERCQITPKGKIVPPNLLTVSKWLS